MVCSYLGENDSLRNASDPQGSLLDGFDLRGSL